MRAHRRMAAALGLLLMLPLAGALAASLAFTATCDYDCGDMGGRGLFLLVLLCTPPAAVGLSLLATTRAAHHPTARLARALLVATVLLSVLSLCAFAIAADIAALSDGDPLFIVVAAVLTAMAASALLALRAAWRKRR